MEVTEKWLASHAGLVAKGGALKDGRHRAHRDSFHRYHGARFGTAASLPPATVPGMRWVYDDKRNAWEGIADEGTETDEWEDEP